MLPAIKYMWILFFINYALDISTYFAFKDTVNSANLPEDQPFIVVEDKHRDSDAIDVNMVDEDLLPSGKRIETTLGATMSFVNNSQRETLVV